MINNLGDFFNISIAICIQSFFECLGYFMIIQKETVWNEFFIDVILIFIFFILKLSLENKDITFAWVLKLQTTKKPYRSNKRLTKFFQFSLVNINWQINWCAERFTCLAFQLTQYSTHFGFSRAVCCLKMKDCIFQYSGMVECL